MPTCARSSKVSRPGSRRHARHRLLHRQRRHRALGRAARSQTQRRRLPRRAGFGRRRGRAERHARHHDRRRASGLRTGATGARGDGQDGRALRPQRQRPGDEGDEPDHVRRHHPRRAPKPWRSRRRTSCRSNASCRHARRGRGLELVLRAPRAEHGARRVPGRIPRASCTPRISASAATWRRASACTCRWSTRCSPNTRS